MNQFVFNDQHCVTQLKLKLNSFSNYITLTWLAFQILFWQSVNRFWMLDLPWIYIIINLEVGVDIQNFFIPYNLEIDGLRCFVLVVGWNWNMNSTDETNLNHAAACCHLPPAVLISGCLKCPSVLFCHLCKTWSDNNYLRQPIFLWTKTSIL